MIYMVSILYLDDELLNLTVFKINFQSKFHVYTARDPEDALALMDSEQEISIIISDMKMPKMKWCRIYQQGISKVPWEEILNSYRIFPY